MSLAPAPFMDSEPTETHTATIAWGDGTVEEGIVNESQGSGTVSGTHTYADNGIFTVTLSVVDETGGIGSDTFTVIVPVVLGVSGFGQFWVREIGVKKLLV